MPEAYGGVIVDYRLGQTLNANQAEKQAKWNTEKKKKKSEWRQNLEKKQAHLFLFYEFVAHSEYQVCKTISEPAYSNSHRLFSAMANHAKHKPRGDVPHGEQDMLLCLDVTHSGCSGWSCALMWS